jgi:hypothetical protein
MKQFSLLFLYFMFSRFTFSLFCVSKINARAPQENFLYPSGKQNSLPLFAFHFIRQDNFKYLSWVFVSFFKKYLIISYI